MITFLNLLDGVLERFLFSGSYRFWFLQILVPADSSSCSLRQY